MSGYVYAMQSGDAVKIGFSHKPAMRARNLRTGNPSHAEMLGFVPATPKHERELHALLTGARIKGEWFRRADRLVERFIEMLPPLPRKMSIKTNGALPPLKNMLHDRGIKLADVARNLGVDKGRVTRWSQHRIPAERVLDVEKATGISRHDLRPDLWPPEESDQLRP